MSHDLDGSDARDGAIVDDDESSPRTSLLSPPLDGDHGESHRPRRRGPSERYRKVRELAHSGISSDDLLRLLVDEEYQSQKMRRILYRTLERLEMESRRAAQAEQLIFETSQKYHSINDARFLAEQDGARARQELGLYKLQLDNAQREISRAQQSLTTVEAQRDEADASAARARTIARKLNEERLVQVARDEGRRLGFVEGLRSGRQMLYNSQAGEPEDDQRGVKVNDHSYHGDGGSVRSDSSSGPPIQVQDLTSSPVAAAGNSDYPPRTEGRFRENFSADPVEFLSPAAQTMPIPDPDPPSRPEPPSPALGRTPPIQVYSLPIPTHEELYGHPPAPSNAVEPTLSVPAGDFAYRSQRKDSPPYPLSTDTSRGRRSHGLAVREDSNAGGSPVLSEGRRRYNYSERSYNSGSRPTSRGVGAIYGPPKDSITRAADYLKTRYMDDTDEFYARPSNPEEWPRLGDESEFTPQRNRPPRQRPTNMFTPVKSSELFDAHLSGYPRNRSVASHSERSQGKPTFAAAEPHESPVPGITIEPPSRSPSDPPAHLDYQSSSLLSPEHANIPLSLPDDGEPASANGAPLVPHVPNSPGIVPLPPTEFMTSLQGDSLPEGFVPDYSADSLPQPNTDGSQRSPLFDTWNFPLLQPHEPNQKAFTHSPISGSRPISPSEEESRHQLPNLRARSNHSTTPRQGYLAARSPRFHLQDGLINNDITPSRMAQQIPLPPSTAGSPRLIASRVPSRNSQIARSSPSLSYVTDPFPEL